MGPTATLDDVDRRIVQLLRANARQTFGSIGDAVGLSAPAVKRRVDRLERDGVVLGYTAVVDHALLGEPLEAFVELRFTGSTRVDAIEGLADRISEVQALFTIAGDPDALAWLRVRDVDHLKRTIDSIRRERTVAGTKTLMVLGSVVRS